MEYDVNSYGNIIFNEVGSVSRYWEYAPSIFELLYGETPSIQYYPQYINIIKGNVTVAYTIDAKRGSEGTYYFSFGWLSIIGLVGENPSKLYSDVFDVYNPNYKSPKSEIVGHIVAIEGTQVIYVRYNPVQW